MVVASAWRNSTEKEPQLTYNVHCMVDQEVMPDDALCITKGANKRNAVLIGNLPQNL